MKLLPTVTAIALSVALAAPAMAMVSTSELNAKVQAAVRDSGPGQVSVNVRGDTAYLSGWTENSQQSSAAVREALKFEGIERVVDGVID